MNWAQFQKTCESDILKEKAHSKALQGASQTVSGSNRSQLGSISKSALPSSVNPAASLKAAKNKKARMKFRQRKAQARKEKADTRQVLRLLPMGVCFVSGLLSGGSFH